MKYDLNELIATARIGGKIISALRESMIALDNPEEYTQEQVSEAWIFITGLKEACDYNKKIAAFGAHHGMTSTLDGFEKRRNVPALAWLNPIFKPDIESDHE